MKLTIRIITVVAILITFGILNEAAAQGYTFIPKHQNSLHQGGMGYFFGENLPDTTVTGVVSIDSAYVVSHYYLDVDLDATEDYFLSFGPWWYSPDSLKLPENGDNVTITGRLHEGIGGIPVIVVEYLNGSLWRGLSNGLHGSGGWVYRNATDTTRIFCPVDSSSFVAFPPGSMGMGGMWGNSFFVDMNLLPSEWMPDSLDNMIAGFHMEYITESGQDMMHGDWVGMGGMGGNGMGRMNFLQEIPYRFHYDHSLLDSMGVDEGNLSLHYWDQSTNMWMPFSETGKQSVQQGTSSMIHNVDGDYFELISLENYDYIAILNLSVTGVEDETDGIHPDKYRLLESYPNPFNPAVSIRFSLEKTSNISMFVYSVTGRLVRTITKDKYSAGLHIFSWDGNNESGKQVAAGVYIVRLSTPGYTLSKKVTFLK